MKWIMSLGWRIALNFVKFYYIILKECEFEAHSFISYLTRLEGHNHIGRNTYVVHSKVGYGSNISFDAYFYNTVIGKYTCIGPRCVVVCGQHPIDTMVSIHPAFFSNIKQGRLSYTNKQSFQEYKFVEGTNFSVVIGNDVWIGADVKILEGVKICDGAVLGAGALVTKDVKPYEIVVGVPAKVINNRFTKDEIEWLLKLRWWDKPEKWIKENAPYFLDIEKLKERVRDMRGENVSNGC